MLPCVECTLGPDEFALPFRGIHDRFSDLQRNLKIVTITVVTTKLFACSNLDYRVAVQVKENKLIDENRSPIYI